jgi:AcrR family transcriptional regulator
MLAMSLPGRKSMPRYKPEAPTREPDDVDAPRTRGGWTPTGTAADRRANHVTKGTVRGERTRTKLVEAARTVFERSGYFEASVDDIVKEAGVARGSFYTYFEDKLQVFRVLSLEVHQAIGAAIASEPGPHEVDPIVRLHNTNLRYIETYQKYAKLWGLIEQVATIDPVIHAERIERRGEHVDRITAFIERSQRRGQADPTIDPATTAALLASMSSNFCYWWFVGGEPHEIGAASKALTQTWVNVIGLRRQPDQLSAVGS